MINNENICKCDFCESDMDYEDEEDMDYDIN